MVTAARELVAGAPLSELSLGAVARRAGVSRITIYNQFGSKALLLRALTDISESQVSPAPATDPREALQALIREACTRWAADPALSRSLGQTSLAWSPDMERRLAERLAGANALRPGCSIKEAEDVIGALTSFPVFDRLHKNGRRPLVAVAEILRRLASPILA
ncbi:MAG: TetR/AcrR family transcriptional regulator [Candidatus Dormibacterales bacterium]